MRNFIVGCVVEVVLASLPVFAQLYPYDAPLKERLAAENAALELQQRWQLDMAEPGLRDTIGKVPCR